MKKQVALNPSDLDSFDKWVGQSSFDALVVIPGCNDYVTDSDSDDNSAPKSSSRIIPSPSGTDDILEMCLKSPISVRRKTKLKENKEKSIVGRFLGNFLEHGKRLELEEENTPVWRHHDIMSVGSHTDMNDEIDMSSRIDTSSRSLDQSNRDVWSRAMTKHGSPRRGRKPASMKNLPVTDAGRHMSEAEAQYRISMSEHRPSPILQPSPRDRMTLSNTDHARRSSSEGPGELRRKFIDIPAAQRSSRSSSVGPGKVRRISVPESSVRSPPFSKKKVKKNGCHAALNDSNSPKTVNSPKKSKKSGRRSSLGQPALPKQDDLAKSHRSSEAPRVSRRLSRKDLYSRKHISKEMDKSSHSQRGRKIPAEITPADMKKPSSHRLLLNESDGTRLSQRKLLENGESPGAPRRGRKKPVETTSEDMKPSSHKNLLTESEGTRLSQRKLLENGESSGAPRRSRKKPVETTSEGTKPSSRKNLLTESAGSRVSQRKLLENGESPGTPRRSPKKPVETTSEDTKPSSRKKLSAESDVTITIRRSQRKGTESPSSSRHLTKLPAIDGVDPHRNGSKSPRLRSRRSIESHRTTTIKVPSKAGKMPGRIKSFFGAGKDNASKLEDFDDDKPKPKSTRW